MAGLISPSEPSGRLKEIQNSYQKNPPNSFENDVERWLKNTFGPTLSIESQVVIAGIATDFVIGRSGKKFVIECDGNQYHLTGGPDGGQQLGRDIIQDRVLAQFGYSVLHILYSEFQSPRGKLGLVQRIDSLLR